MHERALLTTVLIGSLAIGAGAVLVAAGDDRAPQAPPVVEAGKVKKFRGKAVTVCGRVVTYDCDTDRRDTRLDLDKPYWNNPPGVLIDAASRGAFGLRLEDRYVYASVCATGVVARLKGRDVVRVEKPEQIVVKQPAPPGPFGPAAVRACDAKVTLPKLVKEVRPSYTADAMRGLLQGRVFLDALVVPGGTVGPIQILAGFKPDLGLHASAARAVQQWQFEPGTLDGKPVPVIVSVELTFTLK